MAYNQFSLAQVQSQFELVVTTPPNLFPNVASHAVSASFRQRYPGYATLANTEAGRSHFLIAPMLGEVWLLANHGLALFVGNRFDVDESLGLNGVCDFILGRPPQLNYVTAPVMMIVEAKNEDIWGGVGQCAAAMVAAQRFNAARPQPDRAPIHGAVTDGERWRFLRLDGKRLDLESADRLISDPDRILGILLHITGITPAAPLAA